MRHISPLQYATPGAPHGRCLVLVSLAVFSLPLLATAASLVALWTGPDPGRVEDALVGVMFGVLPAVVLSALQYIAVFRRVRAMTYVVLALSLLGSSCWVLLLVWRFSFQVDRGSWRLSPNLWSTYLFLAVAATVAAANALTLWRRQRSGA